MSPCPFRNALRYLKYTVSFSLRNRILCRRCGCQARTKSLLNQKFSSGPFRNCPFSLKVLPGSLGKCVKYICYIFLITLGAQKLPWWVQCEIDRKHNEWDCMIVASAIFESVSVPTGTLWCIYWDTDVSLKNTSLQGIEVALEYVMSTVHSLRNWDKMFTQEHCCGVSCQRSWWNLFCGDMTCDHTFENMKGICCEKVWLYNMDCFALT